MLIGKTSKEVGKVCKALISFKEEKQSQMDVTYIDTKSVAINSYLTF